MASTTLELTVDRAERLIRTLTDGLVNIKDETGEFLVQLPDGSKIQAKEWNGWEWTQGVALTTLYEHSTIAPDSDAARYSISTIMGWFEEQYKATNGRGAPKNINTMAPLLSLAGLLADGRISGDTQKWLGWCDDWGRYIMEELPRTQQGGFQHITYVEENRDQLWDDTLVMAVLPLAKIGILLDRPAYIEEAKYQFLLHVQCLMEPTNGLWYHGYQFEGESEGEGGGGHNFARAFWARGNCWITIAIPLFIDVLNTSSSRSSRSSSSRLSPSDPVYRSLKSVFERQVDALVKTQDAQSGLWHTLLDDPTSYLEASATAGFAAGIYAGLRLGLVTGDNYRQCADNALRGVLANLQDDGELDNVSYGTPMGHTLQFYKDIPITPMPYGQALAMLALVEWGRLQGNA